MRSPTLVKSTTVGATIIVKSFASLTINEFLIAVVMVAFGTLVGNALFKNCKIVSVCRTCGASVSTAGLLATVTLTWWVSVKLLPPTTVIVVMVVAGTDQLIDGLNDIPAIPVTLVIVNPFVSIKVVLFKFSSV